MSNQPACAKLLLQFGANANITNSVGERPYDIAVKFGRTQVGMVIESATSEEGDKIVKVIEEDDSFAEDSARDDSQGGDSVKGEPAEITEKRTKKDGKSKAADDQSLEDEDAGAHEDDSRGETYKPGEAKGSIDSPTRDSSSLASESQKK